MLLLARLSKTPTQHTLRCCHFASFIASVLLLITTIPPTQSFSLFPGSTTVLLPTTIASATATAIAPSSSSSTTASRTLSSSTSVQLAASSSSSSDTDTTETTCTSATMTGPSAATKENRPYGSWISPITSQSITAGSVGIGNLHVTASSAAPDTAADTLYWTEARSQEGGRNVVCRYDPTHEHKSDRDAIDITPPVPSNVRSRVHEYGGGALTFASTTAKSDSDDAVFYTEFATQHLFRMNLKKNADATSADTTTTGSNAAAGAQPVTVTKNDETGRYRYADGVYDTQRNLLICIREDHGTDGQALPKDVINEIVAVDVSTTATNDDDNNNDNETSSVRVLVTGYDFTVAPKLSIDGKKLACIVWDHPNMPWDSTKLVTVTLPNPSENLLSETAVIGPPKIITGQDNDTSVIQPMFHPITGQLFYISDQSGYYTIYMVDDNDDHHMVLPKITEVDFGGPSPGWGLGQMGYTFLSDGRLLATYKDKNTGRSILLVTTSAPQSNAEYVEYTNEDGLPLQFGGMCGGMTKNTVDDLYFIGGSPGTPSSVYYWSLKNKGEAKVLACSSTLQFDDSMISIPQQIEFPTSDDTTAFGYYYPPKNGNYDEQQSSSGPPLLVKAHGGPTGAASMTFNPSIQYWTSRGFAILDVDYGGSTGYGKLYRRRLRGKWGIVDVDDVCNGAKYLADKGLADPDRLCIDGGSAGGFTTLAALAFRDVFKAGTSLYGVADLTALARDTHKFESRYLDGLIGSYPKDENIYKERSPIEHVDQLSCPILLLQGEEDKIVPPNQAEAMYDALKSKKIPTCLKMYQGEQHGFRKAENREDALDSELSFYGKVFDIDIPDSIDLVIDNL